MRIEQELPDIKLESAPFVLASEMHPRTQWIL
jgi:hypothetical protein